MTAEDVPSDGEGSIAGAHVVGVQAGVGHFGDIGVLDHIGDGGPGHPLIAQRHEGNRLVDQTPTAVQFWPTVRQSSPAGL